MNLEILCNLYKNRTVVSDSQTGNTPMVGMTVSVAVAVEESLKN